MSNTLIWKYLVDQLFVVFINCILLEQTDYNYNYYYYNYKNDKKWLLRKV